MHSFNRSIEPLVIGRINPLFKFVKVSCPVRVSWSGKSCCRPLQPFRSEQSLLFIGIVLRPRNHKVFIGISGHSLHYLQILHLDSHEDNQAQQSHRTRCRFDQLRVAGLRDYLPVAIVINELNLMDIVRKSLSL
jgi:hypothetical protein